MVDGGDQRVGCGGQERVRLEVDCLPSLLQRAGVTPAINVMTPMICAARHSLTRICRVRAGVGTPHLSSRLSPVVDHHACCALRIDRRLGTLRPHRRETAPGSNCSAKYSKRTDAAGQLPIAAYALRHLNPEQRSRIFQALHRAMAISGSTPAIEPMIGAELTSGIVLHRSAASTRRTHSR